MTERQVFEAARAWAVEAMRMALDDAAAEGKQKSDPFDIVTPADGAIERYLRGQVRERFPDHEFLGEEEGGADGASGWQWVVDPIDGTYNYATGLSGAATSIACRHDGELVVGVIADLTAQRVYGALRGTRTIVVRDAGGTSVHEPSNTPAGAARIFLEFGWEDLDAVMVGTIEDLAGLRPRVIRMVSGAAYALLNVALRGGSFLGIGLRIWDLAAGIVLVREAGHQVRMWQEGGRVHLVVGAADDIRELTPIVERYGSSRVALAS